MFKPIILLIILVSTKESYAQENVNSTLARDTILVGKLISFDSLISKSNATRTGVKYYYGIRHIEIGIKNESIAPKMDTFIVAYVYNKITESALNSKNFNLTTDSFYIFILGTFSPCSSDFPRIDGKCDVQGIFSPVSTTLTKGYMRCDGSAGQWS